MRLWDDSEWAENVHSHDWPQVRDALESRGVPVADCMNGKPLPLEGRTINYNEAQAIVESVLSGSFPVQPAPSKPKPPVAEKKEPVKKKAPGKKK